MPERRSFDALIVAAGSGSRAGGGLPKQYRPVAGKPMLRHSAQRFAAHPGCARIWVAIGKDQESEAGKALDGIAHEAFVIGGATRRASVSAGLDAISAAGGCDSVMIHDAARPFLPHAVIDALLDALEDAPGAVPALPMVDSIARGQSGLMGETVAREDIWRIQTPQAFRFDAIAEAHRTWPENRDASDDARMAQAAGHAVAIVPGSERLAKITYEEDFADGGNGMNTAPSLRIGQGYDVHRLVEGEQLWLCGLQIPHSHGLSGHSDADVALHAITDAILGALAEGDIGTHFPPSDARWKGAPSRDFLAFACDLMRERGFAFANIDLTLICEAPKIGPHREAMRAKIAEIGGETVDKISVKATTTERLGFTGRGEAIAAEAVALLTRRL